MQIVENWADVTGTVRSVTPDARRAGFVDVELVVERIADVAGFPNLLGRGSPATLDVLLREEVVHRLGISVGVRLRCRARLAGGRAVFAHPDETRLVG